MPRNKLRWITLLLGACIAFSGAWAATQSTNIAIIGSGTSINGGFLPTSGADLVGMTFTNLAPAAVNAANLAPFDTVVLNLVSSQMSCNMANLSAAARADLVAFVSAGHKLIIWDSECSAVDYSWLPYPFSTNNPGQLGAQGTLTIVEENTLSTNAPGPYYIDAAAISTLTDAVGDANVLTTFDPHWCVDMQATNANVVTGPTHTYAKVGMDAGLIIYSGLDIDYMGIQNAGADYLRKIYVQELLQPFDPSNLPCGVTVVPGDIYQVAYAANLSHGDSFVDITNAGTNGSVNKGNLCANVYVFEPDEQLVACCACPLTPNASKSFSVVSDLISNTLTPGVPSAVTVAVVASSDAACNAAAVSPASLAGGMRAWMTTIHAMPGGQYGATEFPFTYSTLSAAALTRMTQFCAYIQANGSGYGICRACRMGTLGAAAK